MSNKLVIICVDDEKFVLDTLNDQLQKKFGDKYDYELTERAEEALELIEELSAEGRRIGMIISDQIMPGISGDKFLATIHAKYPKAIKILLTGQATLESAVNAINNANLYRYLPKPWGQEDFLLTVEKGLAQYELLELATEQSDLFKKFLPNELINILSIASLNEVRLGQHITKHMSIFCCAIEDFAALAKKMNNDEIYNLINDYLKHVEPIIKNNKGFIDKFLGDGFIALFHNCNDALKASKELQKSMLTFNNILIRNIIGIDVADVIMAIIGTDSTLQGSVITNAISIVSKAKNVASSLSSKILVTEELIIEQTDLEKTKTPYRYIGKMTNIPIYEVLDANNDESIIFKIKTKADFDKGLKLFAEKKFTESIEYFKKIIDENKQDKIAELYLKLAKDFLAKTVTDDWDGCILT